MKIHLKKHPPIIWPGEVLPFFGFVPVPYHHSNVTLTKLFGGKGRFVEESGDVEVCKIDF